MYIDLYFPIVFVKKAWHQDTAEMLPINYDKTCLTIKKSKKLKIQM